MDERLDKVANRDYSNVHRLDERLRFPTEPSRINARKLIVPWMVSHLRDGDCVVDIAGGIGTYASLISRERNVTIVGVDISEGVIAARNEDEVLGASVVGDMEALPFEAESFDAAMFVACLHHVPDPLPALREARRVLRPGGRLFTFEPSSVRARRAGSAPIPGHPHEFRMSGAWLAERATTAGFEVEELWGRRLAIRLLRPAVREPSLRLLHLGDAVDRVLRLVPGAEQLGEVAMLRARKPA